MTAQFARAPYSGRPPVLPNNPQAALLIDFDNVTMGIRSDITKELKNLLNSDVIKGKVAVQRAYADWRRYPQYIVPLAEASVDLIFAPAYGSSKKNATDIRLAIDALELVFTRSEIGTFILLSGDSDFSSLVLKLKEYGKYVVGVGIRESASDLLVQNCDEYYSYSALTGLTRAGEETTAVRSDPWELVDTAVRQMADNNDVMRSDRLKQVILELDPNFDEKQLGFPKFNRFLQEASNRGMLRLHKMENGQFEVAVPEPGAAEAAAQRDEERGDGRARSRGRRGRGRDRERREERVQTEPRAPAEPRPSAEPRAAPEPLALAESRTSAEPRPAAEPRIPPEPRTPTEPRPQAASRTPPEPRVQATPAPAVAERAAVPVPPASAARDVDERRPRGDRSELGYAHDLLRRATADVTRGGGAARDSDVKRRILEIDGAFDESAWGFSKFSRFLRQAHDAEVITLRKLENGNYEVLLADAAEKAEEAGPARLRRDRGPRPEERPREPRPPREPAQRDVLALDRGPDRAGEFRGTTTQATQPAPRPAAATPVKEPVKPPAEPAAPSPQPATAAASPARALGLRRGSRGGRTASGPPPLLEGQTVNRAKPPAEVTPPAAAAPAPEPAAEEPAVEQKRVRGRSGKPAAPVAAAAKRNEADAGAVVERLVGYKGVGRRSAEALVDAFGAANVFDGLEREPDRVKELLGARRGDALLEAYRAEAGAAPAAGRSAVDAPSGDDGAEPANGGAQKARRPRGRRGGRRGKRAGSGAAGKE